MKLFKIVLTITSLYSCSAFTPVIRNQSCKQHFALHSTKSNNSNNFDDNSKKLATAFLASLTIASQLTFPSSVFAANSLGDQFALPSYSEAITQSKVELDLDTVNKDIMAKAKAKREDKAIDAENRERTKAVKKDEDDEDYFLERMKRLADEERREKIEKEKADTRANRWNTF